MLISPKSQLLRVNSTSQRVQGQRSKSTRPSTNKLLNDAQERAVRSYLARCDKLGMPAMVPQLKGAIQRILDLNHPDGKAPSIGQHFITSWLAANPDCKRIKQKPKEINWVAANSRKVYKDHFKEFKTVVHEYGITQGDVYNMDETGFRIGVGGSQWIITMEFKKPQLSPSETNRDFITSVEAISADGEVLPPLLIVQGPNHLQQWYMNTALPDNYLIGTSPLFQSISSSTLITGAQSGSVVFTGC